MLGVRTAFDGDAQNWLRLLHGYVQIASIIRYNVGIVFVTVRRLAAHRCGHRTAASAANSAITATSHAIMFGGR